jgi:hypothetical protein
VPKPDELRKTWAADEGAYRDIYVPGTTAEDWQRALDAVTARWPSTYSEDGESAVMPRDVGTILSRRSERSTLLRIHLHNHLDFDVHFFGADEIEFTFDPAEVTDDEDVGRILEFVLHLGRTVGRTVHMTVESHSGRRPADDLRYDPKLDRITRSSTPWATLRSGATAEHWRRRRST